MKKEGTESECCKCGTTYYRPPSNRGEYCSRACWYSSKPRVDIYTRLWAKIDKSGGSEACWEWGGAILKTGYGSINSGSGGQTLRAHRVAYESVNGAIPDGYHVLHTCDNRKCCNPSHHFLGDPKANSDDKISKGRDKNKGEEHHNCKLSADDICAIKAIGRTHTGKYIAGLYGVSAATISLILSGKSRVHG